MCPTGLKLMERRKGYMDVEKFKGIIDEMAPHVRATTLHIWGEPLLHPRLFEMIDYCKRHPIKVEISSNATLLTEEKAKLLLKTNLDMLYLCMDGACKETYEKIRRKADFDETKANIKRFLNLKTISGSKKPYVNLQLVEMKLNKAEVERFKAEWVIPGVDDFNIKAFDSWGNQVDKINALKPEDKNVTLKRYHCPNLWYHAHIYWDGTLVCCDRDYDAKYPLGNVFLKGVMAAWNGESMRELRQQHIEGDLKDVPSCRKCTEWTWWKPSPFSARGNAPQ